MLRRRGSAIIRQEREFQRLRRTSEFRRRYYFEKCYALMLLARGYSATQVLDIIEDYWNPNRGGHGDGDGDGDGPRLLVDREALERAMVISRLNDIRAAVLGHDDEARLHDVNY